MNGVTTPADLQAALKHLSDPVALDDGSEVDYFSYKNPDWQAIGVLVSGTDAEGHPRLGIRTSFQSRDAMANELFRRLHLSNSLSAVKHK